MAYITPSQELLSNPHLQELFKALAEINDPKTIEKVLSDALTHYELEILIRRWQAIKMIAKKIPYRQIAQDLNISTSTVNKAAFSYYQEKEGWRILLNHLGYN